MKVEGISLPRANKRLTELYNRAIELADGNDIIADVGTDHGYLAAMLAKSGKYNKVIATDISAPSLQKAQLLAEKLKLNIETRVGDGLQVVQDVNFACICGMGGYEIIKIITDNKTVNKFVFQPVQNAMELREYLLKNKYKIIKDYVVADKDKFYTIITVNGYGKNIYKKHEKLLGKNNIQNIEFVQYLQNQLNKLKFLEKFDITSIDKKQRKDIRQKIKFRKICQKILKQVGSV